MYVPQSAACTVPNSADPVSTDQIQTSQQTLASLQAVVASANSSFSTLLQRPDLNAAGMRIQFSTSGSNPGTQPTRKAIPVYRAFDSQSVPLSGQAPARLNSWPAMCVGNGGSLAEPTPRDSNVAVPPTPMKPLTIPPVGGPPLQTNPHIQRLLALYGRKRR